MEGIMVWRGDVTKGEYIEVWCKAGDEEMYLTDFDITSGDITPDEDVFLQGGPKCLIKW